MKNTHIKQFLAASLLTLTVSAANAGKVTVAQFASPDENRPECADTPAELATMSDLVAIVNSLGGLNGVVGTWKLGGLAGSLSKQQLSFKYDATQFIVQVNDDLPEQVSLCASTSAKGTPVLRVAVHTPGCPENKNIYISSNGPNKMNLTAYGTKQLGTAKFNKKSNTPLPDGRPKPPVACAKG